MWRSLKTHQLEPIELQLDLLLFWNSPNNLGLSSMTHTVCNIYSKAQALDIWIIEILEGFYGSHVFKFKMNLIIVIIKNFNSK